MPKLIAAFQASPSPKSAQALCKYVAKHPMAKCLMDACELASYKAAKALAQA
jgi:hypothetical protein